MKVNIKRQIWQFVVLFVVVALALFLPAGTIVWLAGWLFLALFFGFFVSVNIWLSKYNAGLLEERTRLGTTDQQGWDKVLFPLLSAFPVVWLIFISFDAVRFHWSPVPFWLQGVGVAI